MSRGRGEDVLFLLVRREEPLTVAEIAHGLGLKDGRSVHKAVTALSLSGMIEIAEMVVAGGERRRRWRPTARGREIDAILDRVTVARGGKFSSLRDAGIAWNESYALRA